MSFALIVFLYLSNGSMENSSLPEIMIRYFVVQWICSDGKLNQACVHSRCYGYPRTVQTCAFHRLFLITPKGSVSAPRMRLENHALYEYVHQALYEYEHHALYEYAHHALYEYAHE